MRGQAEDGTSLDYCLACLLEPLARQLEVSSVALDVGASRQYLFYLSKYTQSLFTATRSAPSFKA